MDSSSPDLRGTRAAAAPRSDAVPASLAGVSGVHIVRAADVAPRPWRNGGGRTRELLAWPSTEAWSLRISFADIESDGPFSAFPGVQRWFAVVEGEGVALAFDDVERVVRPGDAPLAFDGARAPGCRLLDGPTRDLNLMVRGGSAAMTAIARDKTWTASFMQGGFFSAVAGRWSAGAFSLDVGPHTLVWIEAVAAFAPGPWRFDPHGANARTLGWWLAHSPSNAS